MELEGEVRLPAAAPSEDLGIGAKAAEQSRVRLLNRDGTFNVERTGLPAFRSLNLYHHLLTIPWLQFQLLVAAAYLVVNVLFAFAYVACGRDALAGTSAVSLGGRLEEAFFFSVQTLATIGYGSISPKSTVANVIVTLEALTGMLGFALATGILFSRFSRPSADLLFSKRAIIAPYHGGKAFEFRIVNSRSNQLTEVEATVVLSMGKAGARGRQFFELKLERNSVMFLPLHWVVVHPIDESSPLFGMNAAQLTQEDAEFLILIKAVDETFSQTVHRRASYRHDEVEWNVRFRDMFAASPDGRVRIDVRRLDEVEPS